MSTVSKKIQSFLKLEDEDRSRSEHLGISSILCSSDNKSRLNKTESLRRTFSADMSSKKWLAQQQMFPLKKIASSDYLTNMFPQTPSSSSLSSDEKVKGETDIWSSVQSQKKSDSNPGNYIHPLVKRSNCTLSKKSLEICSESLGSETGFDSSSETDSSLFSSSEDEDDSSKEETKQQGETRELNYQSQGFTAVNYNCRVSRKSPHRSFPPPLRSISSRDGPCLHMKPVRHEGRLVLQAVHVPSQSYFQAQRQDGRLLLSFITPTTSEEEKINFPITQMEKTQEIDDTLQPKLEEKLEDVMNEKEEEEQCEEDKKNVEELKNPVDVRVINQLSNLNPSAFVINKIISEQFANLNPWNQKLQKEQDPTKVAKTATVNVYEYYWRKPLQQHQEHKIVAVNKFNREFLRDKGEIQARRCKETRRSLLFWESFCIATS